MVRISSGHRFRGCLVVASSLTILWQAGCADTPTEVRQSSRTAAASHVAKDVASDPGIDQSDTWVSETEAVVESSTVTSDQPFLDPTSQQYVTTLNIGIEPETATVVAGYGWDGQPTATVGYSAADSTETALVRQIGDSTYDAQSGGALKYATFDVEPMATLGDFAQAQLATSYSGSGPCDSCNQLYSARPGGAATPLGSADRHVLRLDSRHLRITSVEAGAPGPMKVRTDLRPGISSSPPAGASGTNHRSERDFEKRGKDWVLVHALDEVTGVAPHGRFRVVVHQNILRLSYFRNDQKDAARQKKAATSDTSHGRNSNALSQSGLRPLYTVTVQQPDGCDADPDLTAGGCIRGPSSYPYDNEPAAPNQTVLSTDSYSYPNNGGSIAVALQHGFFSDAGTWKRMTYWLNNDLYVGGLDVPTTQWQQSYEDQAGELAASVQNSFGGTPTVLVGHSNGGMISRYLAEQQYGHGPVNVAGVVAIGTPHWGAPLADAASALLRLFGLADYTSVLTCTYTDTAGCTNLTLALSSGIQNEYRQYSAAVPVLSEMHWHDEYHTSFNSVPEAFQRFGIASQMWTKWMF